MWLQHLMIRRGAPEPLTVFALSPFDAHARIGHGISHHVSINLLDELRGGFMCSAGFTATTSLESIRLHDLHERFLCSRPGEDLRPKLGNAPPLLFYLASRW